MKEDEHCFNCRFCFQVEQHTDYETEHYCRRYPVCICPDGNEVQEFHWCGEWQPKKKVGCMTYAEESLALLKQIEMNTRKALGKMFLTKYRSKD